MTYTVHKISVQPRIERITSAQAVLAQVSSTATESGKAPPYLATSQAMGPEALVHEACGWATGPTAGSAGATELLAKEPPPGAPERGGKGSGASAPEAAGPVEPQYRCLSCVMAHRCMGQELTRRDIGLIEESLVATIARSEGSPLYEEGEAFKYLYIVRSGSIKHVKRIGRGRTSVVGLTYPGEVIGLDGFAGAYQFRAVAAEHLTVCAFSHPRLRQMCQLSKPVDTFLYGLVGDMIQTSISLQVLMACSINAPMRVAGFLAHLARRTRDPRSDEVVFGLGLSRREVGDFLGLNDGTVTRALTELQSLGLIVMSGGRVRVGDIRKLVSYSRLEGL